MPIYNKTWLVVLFLLCACSEGMQKKSSRLPDGLQKIMITPDQVFDLSGYAGGGEGNPFNLFDENAFVDPRNEPAENAYIPVTNCQPVNHPAIYFGPLGNRIVIDLKIPYLLKEIWVYDRSRTDDSCRIYYGDMRNWKEVSSFITGSPGGKPGWKKINLDNQSRFIMIRFSSYETAITEMVIYGTALQPIPAPDSLTAHKGFTRTPLADFLGVNYIMENEPRWLTPFHYSRLYNFALDYDNDSSRDENKVKFNMLHYGFYSKEKGAYIFDIDTLQHINKGEIWYSIRGVSKWMSDLGFTDKDRPVNRPSLNPEDPASYSRHSRMMWHLAAFFGFHKVDTSRLSFSHRPLQSGRGSMRIFENGNEEDAFWVGNKYCSPVEYFAQSTADWDGDEGRLGKGHGIREADPQSRLMMSGLTGFDTSRVKVYRFLCENLRNDQQFIWKGGIQYHYYAQKAGRGISPEEDSMRWKMSKVADCSFRIAPDVKCFLGENGYDKSPVSRQTTPRIPGLSASQSQGIMLIRSINAAFFSGFDAYILYWLRDGYPEDDPRVYLTSGLLRALPDGKTMVYPGWYYISMMVNRLGKYRPDKIIRENGNVWVYRYRHTDQPDSVACFIYQPTVSGNRPVNYTLQTGKTSGNKALKLSFRDNSDQAKEELIPVSDEKLGLSVEEKPVIVLYKELPAGK